MGAPWNQVDPERLQRMVKAGRTAREMAEVFGVTARTVVRHKKTHGLSRPNPGRNRLPDGWRDQAEALLEEGLSYTAVAEITGVSSQTVSKHLPGRGWDGHTSGTYAVAVQKLNRLTIYPKGAHQ